MGGTLIAGKLMKCVTGGTYCTYTLTIVVGNNPCYGGGEFTVKCEVIHCMMGGDPSCVNPALYDGR